MDFEDKLKLGETQTFSFISSIDNKFEILSTISGMSNSVGGEICIGVNPKGKIKGINHLDIHRDVGEIFKSFNIEQDFAYDIKLIGHKYVCILKIKQTEYKPLSFRWDNLSYSYVRELNQNYKLNSILFNFFKRIEIKPSFDLSLENKVLNLLDFNNELSFSKLSTLSKIKINQLEYILIKLLQERRIGYSFTNIDSVIYRKL
jgi:predicted HTH transcriptional regulator